jgi:hypothetical protein
VERLQHLSIKCVNDVVEAAEKLGKLAGRIKKPYRYFAPVKAQDSKDFPRIECVTTSVQRDNANYFGRFIEKRIAELTKQEKAQAAEKLEPAVLVIGSKPYLPQIERYLTEQNILTQSEQVELSERERALELLAISPDSNLGWRILLSTLQAKVARPIVVSAHEKATRLVDQIAPEMQTAVLIEARAFAEAQKKRVSEDAGKSVPIVKLTSHEGSKGLSAQFVYLVGLQEGTFQGMPKIHSISKFANFWLD